MARPANVGPMKTIALLLALVMPFSGCAAVVSTLPAVIAYATDGMLIISTIESFANQWFQVRPNQDVQKKVGLAISRAKMALDAAVRLASGAEKINQAQIDAAFNEFKLAYLDIVGLMGPLGAMQVGGSELKMKAGPRGDMLIVPEPLALKPPTSQGK